MPEKKVSLLAAILSFLIKPAYSEDKNTKPLHLKFFDLIRVIAFTEIILVPFTILIALITLLFDYKSENHAVADFVLKSSPIVIILTGVILAPLIEELTFRLGLKFNKFNISISLSLLFLVALQIFSFPIPVLISENIINLGNLQGVVNMALLVTLISILIFVILSILKVNFEPLKKNFKWILYLSALIFGLIHLTNYSNLGNMLLLAPFLVAPQIIAGLNLGFLRMKYGFIWGYLGHVLHNALFTIPFIILSFGSDKMKELINSASNNSPEIISSLTSMDNMLLAIIGFYIIFIILSVLILGIQMLIGWVFTKQENAGKQR